LRAADVVHRDAPTCSPDDRVGQVRDRLKAAGVAACIVINSKRIVLGRLTEKSLTGDPEVQVEAVMDPGPSTIRPDAPLDNLIVRMQRRRSSSALVTTSDGELIGILDRGEAERRLHDQHAHPRSAGAGG
jgi:CBS domain-containing protein